jgi:hypothetical protein
MAKNNITKRKRKKNVTKTKSKRNRKYSVKILRKGFPLYASKKYEGSAILEYNKEQELKYNDKCLMQNSSWFGDLDVAKSYKTKDTHIYLWKTMKKVNLLKIDLSNEKWLDDLFLNNKLKFVPTVKFTDKKMKKNDNHNNNEFKDNEYLEMTSNERALFEFKFCFGFIDLKKQYEFMKLLKYLIENGFVDDIKRREGDSIVPKLRRKMKYYNVFSLLHKKDRFNRLSFYDFDKHAIRNLCKAVKEKGVNIAGVYQSNDDSFWFPDLVVYKMNIQEYILFNPQDELKFVEMIE